MTARSWWWASVLMLGLSACGDDEVAEATGDSDAGSPEQDAGGGAGNDGGAMTEDLTCMGTSSLTAGDTTVTLSHGGVERRYLLHVPASYDGTKLVPLVLDIHGLAGSPEYQKSTSGWLQKADQEGFLLVYPEGLTSSWNAGSLCCGQSLTDNVDDEGFLLAVVAKLKTEGCVNPKRVYATGLSNGGAMAHLLACRAADVFAAVAPVSMSNSTLPCEPARGISITMFRASADELVPYDTPDSKFLSAPADFDAWKERNACAGSADTSHDKCETYSGCKDASEVTLCTIPTTTDDAPASGHLLYAPAIRQGVNIPDFVWPVFERHTL
jgi:polyhydroxybutyrate depolymerase